MSEDINAPVPFLNYVHINTAIEEAAIDMNAERQDEQLGLYSRWNPINQSMGKYFRFNTVTQIAGLSGHGKSYFLNQLLDDFMDNTDILAPDGRVFHSAINKDFKEPIVIIHFGFEMDPKDEILRMLSRRLLVSYNYLLSSEWNSEIKDYNKLSLDEYESAVNRLNYLKNKPLYFVPFSGNVAKMYNTVGVILQKHAEQHNIEDWRTIKPVVSLDHTLLVQGENGAKDADIVKAVATFCLMTRKAFKAMVLPLGQCNNNLKSIERINLPALHYPLDSDIYNGAQINWACDNILIIYQPELVNIRQYGLEKIPTEGLVVVGNAKSRKGKIGDIHLWNHLNTGMFTENKEP